MSDSLILGLVHNVALLIAISMLVGFFWKKDETLLTIYEKLLAGFFLGIIGLALMLTPWILVPGLVFDTRSVLLSVSGLFFGFIPTVTAMLITGSYRVILGGDGVWMGIAVIFTSGLIGILWKRLRPEWQHKNALTELYVMGLAVHAAMLGCTVFLPHERFQSTFSTIALPVIIIYPIGTLLFGWLLLNRSLQWKTKRDLFRSEKALKESLKEIEIITSNIPNIIWKADVDVNFRLLNSFISSSIDDMLVLPPGSINNDWDRFIRYVNPEYISMVEEELKKCIQNPGVTITFEFEIHKSTGEPLWVVSSVRAYKENGNTRIYGYITDITDRKRIEKELIIAKEKAEESDRLKSVFLATMSHELRTPLNAIIGFSSLMNENMDKEEIKRFSDIIHNSGNHLLSIIESIFEVALLQSKEAKTLPSRFSCSEVFESLSSYLNIERTQRKKEHILTRFIGDAVYSDVVLLSDKVRISQLLGNLLNNAVKYTVLGEIQYGYTVDGDNITFFIRDTGPGIHGNKKEVVFEKFWQSDDSQSRQLGGVGLGLAICKEIAQLLGGKLWFESSKGKGTVFYFRLEGVVVHASNPVESKDMAEVIPDLSDKTILIVDDVEENLTLLQQMLLPSHAFVISASGGTEALERLRDHPEVNLILVDIKMQGMDGYQTTSEIHRIRPELKVIAQTAYAISGDEAKSLAAGCAGYIAKPFRRKELFSVISKVLK